MSNNTKESVGKAVNKEFVGKIVDKIKNESDMNLQKVDKIRLWKLGSLEYKIPPNPKAVDKLEEILKSQKMVDDDTTLDVIWGPDIELVIIDLKKQ